MNPNQSIMQRSKGFDHKTLTLTIAECMGSQWASRLATLALNIDSEYQSHSLTNFQSAYTRQKSKPPHLAD